MVEYFDRKVVEVRNGAEPEEIVSAWRENLSAFENAHPRVFRKVMKEVLDYTGEKEFVQGLVRVAEELLKRHKKNKNLLSVKIAITYNKYLRYHYGSLVKLYLDGKITYTPQATIEGYGFIINNGEEVA